MTFRKNSLLFYESQTVYVIFAILCLTMIPMFGFELSFLFSTLFLILVFINPRLYNEFVTINETGITCYKAGKRIWKYEWNSIAELQKSSRFRMPSLEIVIYDDFRDENSRVQTGHYFQLGKVAKNAINKYGNVQSGNGFLIDNSKKTGDGSLSWQFQQLKFNIHTKSRWM